MDAIATPFVQGQLWGESLSSVIETGCAISGRPIQIKVDSELNCRVVDETANPHLFVPLIDVEKLDDPSIIDAF